MTNGRGGCASPFDSSFSQFYGRNNALSCRRKPPRHNGWPHSRAGSRDRMICKAVPVPARAPSVTGVSRHQPGASEWAAQDPFLILRISKVSALKKTTFAAILQGSQLDTHSRHTKVHSNSISKNEVLPRLLPRGHPGGAGYGCRRRPAADHRLVPRRHPILGDGRVEGRYR